MFGMQTHLISDTQIELPARSLYLHYIYIFFLVTLINSPVDFFVSAEIIVPLIII